MRQLIKTNTLSKESLDSDKPKVVIIGVAHPLRGGLATYNERLAREYIEQGYDVIIYTFSLQYPGFLFPGKSQYSVEPVPAGINIRIRVNSINPFNWRKVGKEIRKQRPDLVIVKFWIPFMAPCLGHYLQDNQEEQAYENSFHHR